MIKTGLFILQMFILVHDAVGSQQKCQEDVPLDPDNIFSFDSVNMKMRNVPPCTPMSLDEESRLPSDDKWQSSTHLDIKHSTSKEKELPDSSTGDDRADDKRKSSTHLNIKHSTSKEKELPDSSTGDDRAGENCSKLKQSHDSVTSLLRQYVMKLVDMLETKVGSIHEYADIDLRLQVSAYDMSKLRDFGKGVASDFHDIHQKLTNMLQYTSEVKAPESQFYRLVSKIGLSSQELFQILSILLVLLAMLVMLPRIEISWRCLKAILFLIFIVSFIFTWIELYQKEVANAEKILMEKMKDHCPKPEEISAWSNILSFVKSALFYQDDKCREYYHAMMISPVFKHSPMEACAVTFVKTVCTPLEIIGGGINSFLRALLKDHPLHIQTTIIIVVVLVILLLLFMNCRYTIWTPLISIAPADNHRQSLTIGVEQAPVHYLEQSQRSRPLTQPEQGRHALQHYTHLPLAETTGVSETEPRLVSSYSAASNSNLPETKASGNTGSINAASLAGGDMRDHTIVETENAKLLISSNKILGKPIEQVAEIKARDTEKKNVIEEFKHLNISITNDKDADEVNLVEKVKNLKVSHEKAEVKQL